MTESRVLGFRDGLPPSSGYVLGAVSQNWASGMAVQLTGGCASAPGTRWGTATVGSLVGPSVLLVPSLGRKEAGAGRSLRALPTWVFQHQLGKPVSRGQRPGGAGRASYCPPCQCRIACELSLY